MLLRRENVLLIDYSVSDDWLGYVGGYRIGLVSMSASGQWYYDIVAVRLV